MTFSEGDVVTRKTGGPMMTVENNAMPRMIDGAQLVSVIWMDAKGHVHRDTFAGNTLLKWRIVEENET